MAVRIQSAVSQADTTKHASGSLKSIFKVKCIRGVTVGVQRTDRETNSFLLRAKSKVDWAVKKQQQ